MFIVSTRLRATRTAYKIKLITAMLAMIKRGQQIAPLSIRRRTAGATK
jgi:hypothetical protein